MTNQYPIKAPVKAGFLNKDNLTQFLIAIGFVTFTLIELFLAFYIPNGVGIIIAIVFWPLVAFILAACSDLIFNYVFPMNISKLNTREKEHIS